MAVVVRNALFVAKRAASPFALINQPLTSNRCFKKSRVAVARTFGFKLKHAFRFIDLFAGIGGFHLGMKQNGGHCVLACEKDKEARKTYLANHDMDDVPFPDDITTLDAADVPDHEVLCAGFPCQAFSIAGGKEGFNDVRGELVFHMLRIIEAKRPLVFVGENVKNFLNGGNGEWHRTLCDRLDILGYTVISDVLNAAHFGTAQERERVFFVAYRRNAFPNVKTFHMPRGDGQWVSVADILEPNAPAGHRDIKDMVPAPTINKKSPFKRIGKMFGRRGQDARVYDPAGHAATLMASQQNCGLYLVDGTPRALTPRERARLQGFPETFQPHPVMTHANKQFGNSVAVPVVAAIAEAIINQLLQPASQKETTMKNITTAAPEITVIDSTRRKAGNTTSRKHATPKRDKFSNGILKPDTHGQVFTPATLVKDMLALRRNTGRVLEPSCGSGAFSNVLHAEGTDLTALELDREHAPAYAVVQDFFDLPVSERFNTIIGNPPYLRYQDIPAATKAKLDMTNFDRRSNLFYFFIEKCVKHLAPGGELIFVVPREFPKATAARRLNHWLFEQGAVTDFSDIGDKVFDGATPACCVFRFEKGRTDRTMTDGRVFAEHDGQLLFLPAGTRGVPLAEFFTVAVGGLTGADELYTHPLGNLDVVCSTTRKNGKTRKVLHGAHAKLMLPPHKAKLLNRRVRTFNEENWWEWGRKWKESAARRIYVNAKTRQVSPFFTHEATAFDGSVLALFPCNPAMNVDLAVSILNTVDWAALGFVTGDRFLFAQRALERTLIPDAMAEQLRAAISQPVLQLAA